jgi:hypothetical protein
MEADSLAPVPSTNEQTNDRIAYEPPYAAASSCGCALYAESAWLAALPRRRQARLSTNSIYRGWIAQIQQNLQPPEIRSA